jgi:hypothetical protein
VLDASTEWLAFNGFAVGEEALFVSEYLGSRLLRVPLTGGGFDAIAQGETLSWDRNFAADANYVYWPTDFGLVRSSLTSGQTNTLVLFSDELDVTDVRLADGSLYFYKGSDQGGAFVRYGLSEQAVLQTYPVGASFSWSWRSVAAHGSRVAYTDYHDTGEVVVLEAGQEIARLETTSSVAHEVALDETHAWAISRENSGAWVLEYIDIATGHRRAAAYGSGGVLDLVTDDQFVYTLSLLGDGPSPYAQIHAVPKTGESSFEIYRGPPDVGCLALAHGSLFIMEATRVLRLALPPRR